jgi:hypothetical protein
MLSDALQCKTELVCLGRAYLDMLALYTLTANDWSFVK